MARPIDHLLAAKWNHAWYDTPAAREHWPELRKLLLGGPIVSADDVAAWWFGAAGVSVAMRGMEHPPARPPFDSMTVEWWAPVKQGSEMRPVLPNKQVGHVTAFQWRESESAILMYDWGIHKASGKVFWLGWTSVKVNDDGVPIGEPELIGMNEIKPDRRRKLWENTAQVSLLALGMMNCRNVQLREVEPNPALSRKWRKRTGHGLVKHTTIVLPSTRPDSTSAGLRTAVGVPIAAHLVRGHFKTYTDDNPLFGKLTGTYWWGWQARGKAEHGTIIKSYEVGPGGQET